MSAKLIGGLCINTERSIKRPMRDISIDGCEMLGKGAHGEVYRLAPDTMVKVYYPGTDTDRIKRELELARKAFVMGIPTAIPFDLVRVGERYGAVFELLKAIPISDYIRDSEERTDEFISKSVKLLKQLHSQSAAPGDLPSMRKNTITWLENIKDRFRSVIYDKLSEFLRDIPETLTLLHGDVNPGNFMMSDGELMLIDMDTLSTGDPIFELATLYVTYRQFPKINELSVSMFGLTVEKAARMWDSILKKYTGSQKREYLDKIEESSLILGCIRVIDYMNRHPELPDQEKAVQICVEDISRCYNV